MIWENDWPKRAWRRSAGRMVRPAAAPSPLDALAAFDFSRWSTMVQPPHNAFFPWNRRHPIAGVRRGSIGRWPVKHDAGFLTHRGFEEPGADLSANALILPAIGARWPHRSQGPPWPSDFRDKSPAHTDARRSAGAVLQSSTFGRDRRGAGNQFFQPLAHAQ